MGLMKKNVHENDVGWECDECGSETVWTMEKINSPFVPKDHLGSLLTNHSDDCLIGIKQKEALNWQHMSIGFGL